MAKKFEVGKSYEAQDTGVPAIKILSRTAKTATVEDTDTNEVWKMRVKARDNGDEYMVDSRVPAAWRDCYTYESKEVSMKVTNIFRELSNVPSRYWEPECPVELTEEEIAEAEEYIKANGIPYDPELPFN